MAIMNTYQRIRLTILSLAFFAGFGWLYSNVRGASELPTNRLVIHAEQGTNTINRNIYGHFSEHLGRCIYEGIWVGENSSIPNVRGIRKDVVAALRQIKVPVLRWPGGCFADEYHWRDGIGPRSKRPAMINTHWGGVTENNHFGTHEFMDLCAQLGCEPYICGNLGSGSVLEMQEWIEYITAGGKSPMSDLRQKNGRKEPWRLKYFGVGNENWGCGGNMTPEYYADQYRRYATYVRHFGSNRVFKIACGPNGGDYRWTEVLMREVGNRMAGLSLHFYCGSGKKSRSATQYDEADWFQLLRSALRMEELVTKHSEVMDKLDPQKRIALIVDEWGTWHQVEPGTTPGFLYQQNTLRDALVAGITLNIFNQHCDRVKMANIAQTINVLQAMILTRKEKMILTPTYHVYDLYQAHQDATLLPADLQCVSYELGGVTIPGLSASVSRNKEGKIHITLCNLNPHNAAEITCELPGVEVRHVSGRVLTAPDITAHNTFDNPDTVKPAVFSAFKAGPGTLQITLPSKSVVLLELN
jgi:alpha-N-arabinofuranosidase